MRRGGRAAGRAGRARGGGGKGRGGGSKNSNNNTSAAARAASLTQFDNHFKAVFGNRWPALKSSLSLPVEHVAWSNPFAEAKRPFDQVKWSTHSHGSGCALIARALSDDGSPAASLEEMPDASPSGASGLVTHYALDGASPLPALALAPRAGHRVLDLCAAPGGKSLVLAGQMFASAFASSEDGDAEEETNNGAAAAAAATTPSSSPRTLLISNDRSGPRRARLRRVIEEFAPKSLLREPSDLPAPTWGLDNGKFDDKVGAGVGAIAVTGVDASAWGRGPAAPAWSAAGFDRILVDAPCSSERHFLHAAGGPDAVWSKARLKRDAALQGAILRNGVRLLKLGGRLVYSTCSLAEEENDNVVSKLLAHKRHGAGLSLVDALGGPLADQGIAELLKGCQRTSCGALMLPDRSRFGPLYWAVIERTGDGGGGPGGGGESDDEDEDEAMASLGLGEEEEDESGEEEEEGEEEPVRIS